MYPRGQYATYTTADGALVVDETALWLSSLDGHRANRLEDLSAADQESYRRKATFLHEYLLER